MNYRLVILLITLVICIDTCAEQQTYQDCIVYKGEQCQWLGQYCRQSNNYLLGCDPNINELLCVKQFGTLDGIISECIFDSVCHNIYDNHSIKCIDKLSKSGCLSITNQNELCKWEDNQCKYLDQDEIINIKNIFHKRELSASVCSKIDGYLIIHNSLLWNILGYQPNLFQEAENLKKKEAGIKIEINNEYDQSAILQDNYVDNVGRYYWYEGTTQAMISNGELNDFKRYGCIAQEILTENRYYQLFSLTGILRGVNHVYCKYLNIHPSNPVLTIFVDSECLKITEQQLQDQNQIQQYEIECQSLSRIACQKYYNKNQLCQIFPNFEYQCQNVEVIFEINDCDPYTLEATHSICASAKIEPCYLDTSSFLGQCTKRCVNYIYQNDCIQDSQCQWLGQNLNNITQIDNQNFIVCAPLNGCDQLGLNKYYCTRIATNCIWDQLLNRCKSIDLIESYKCLDCNQIFCCSSIIRYDQFCIWQNNSCINVKDQQLYSHFLSFPENTLMNYNLCVNQIGQYNYYNYQTRKCSKQNIDLYTPCLINNQYIQNEEFIECNNPPNNSINQEGCLALINSKTKWDIFQQKCLQVMNINKPCDEFKLVNPNICKHAIINENYICLYDEETFSCTSKLKINIDLKCDTQGINQEECLNLKDQLCAWRSNKCNYLKINEIQQRTCNELFKVSASVCKYSIFSKQYCQYDFNSNGCTVFIEPMIECLQYSNRYACQSANYQCYFDNVLNQCLDSKNYLNVLLCETEWISKQTCINITTPGQRCIWNSKCEFYKIHFYSDCSTSIVKNGNLNICDTLYSNIYLTLIDQQYCEVINDKCTYSITTITDDNCGYDQKMNIFRCMGYTQKLCYFDNYKCTRLTGPINYQNILLNKLACNQSNMQLCTLIQTPGQSCYRSNIRKCTEVEESFNNSCDSIMTLNLNDFSPNICSRAYDSCFYDQNTKKCAIPDKNIIFDCSSTGISYLICRLNTRGACMFQNQFCQLFNDPLISCESRNKKACTMGKLRCYWDQKIQNCLEYYFNCPNLYQNGESFLLCGNSEGYCFAGSGGCINTFNDSLPCWVSLNQQLCNQQSTFCQWIDNNCTNKFYKCEDATTLEQCVLHRFLSCVYENGKCFEIQNYQIYNCNDFEKTTQLFCRNYYPKCIYSQEDYLCEEIYFLGDGIQRDLELSSQGCARIARNYYNCILQTASSCSFTNSFGYKFCTAPWIQNEKCEWYDTTNPYSIQLCQEKPNCRFKMTVEGKPFCYTHPLQCENLDSIMCLLDIPNANCFLDDKTKTCQTFILTPTCDDLVNIQVNYHLCLQASSNSFIPCYYQSQTKMCKMNQNNGDIQQQLSNCISQTKGIHFFNLKYQFCQSKYEINSNYDDIYYCYQMNQISCLSIINDLSCLWVDQKCQENQIIYNSLECERRNYNSCLIGDVSCIWDKDQNKCLNELDSKLCKNCEYSEYYCIQIDQLWDGKNCYQFTTNLPISFHQCEKLGLNQKLCLNNTINLYCFWDGIKCREANLKLQQCTDQVSKSTCLNIQTPYQACVWQNNECVQKYNSIDCKDFLRLQNCRNTQILCQFNLGQNQCQSISSKIENCQNTLSRGACLLVEQEICTWSDNQCQLWPRAKYSCENIFNQWGCLNTTMFCKWEQKCENIETADYSQPKINCLEIPSNFNKVSCLKFSIGPCNYDDTINKCNINLTSDLLDTLEFDLQSPLYQAKLNNDCTNFKTQSACVSCKQSFCQWQQNQCLNCQQDQNCSETCHNNNLLQCLRTTNLLCAWRNNSCVDWIESSNVTLGQLNLVSYKCCSIQNLDVKYDEQLNSCLPLDYQNDDCLTPGLSQYACLKIIKYQCIYEDGQCKIFKFYPKPQCKLFQNVTQKVCQLIPKLSCKYNSLDNQCIDIVDQDDCDTIGLSLEGCMNIKKSPCFWNDQTESCNFYKFEKGINQCNLQIKTNSISCQMLNYHNDVCSYNIEQRTCQQNFNKFSKCDYPGLNRKACLSLQLEPCKFENDKCIKLQNMNVGCLSLLNVNELACQMSLQDNCAYNPIKQNCFVTSTQLPCGYPGLNINSCKNQNNCVWSYDDKKCQCQSITQKQKCNLSQQSCNFNEECIYDFDINICRIKTCFDIKNCQGSVNQLQCYLDSNQICQSASTCEDIINLNNLHTCNEFIFNNSNCIQILNNCVGHKNLKQICLNSDCNNSYCIMDNFQCRPLECNDLKEDECYHKQNCSFINNKCIFIQSCSEINDQNTCVKTLVNKFQCLWEMKEIFDRSKYCTNSYCSIYSNIPSLCNGNEINQYSCKMDKFYQCKMCEEITDPCECRDNDNNFCNYQDGMCRSFLCSEFLQEKNCNSSKKCYWSNQDSVCRKFCKYLIIQEECEGLNYECNWNPYKFKCEQGMAIDTDLSVHFQVQTIFSIILEISLIAILI